MRTFQEQTGATFPIGWAIDNSYSTFRRGSGASISPFPLDVIIDQDGRIAYLSAEYEPALMQAVVESLLGPAD